MTEAARSSSSVLHPPNTPPRPVRRATNSSSKPRIIFPKDFSQSGCADRVASPESRVLLQREGKNVAETGGIRFEAAARRPSQPPLRLRTHSGHGLLVEIALRP